MHVSREVVMEEKGPVVEQIRDKVEEVSGEKYVAEFEELLEDVCKRMTKNFYITEGS